jgi:hypothetical protein
LLLFVLHPLYVYWHRDLIGDRLKRREPQLLLLGTGFCLVAGFVLWGIFGQNPLLNFPPGQYSRPIFYLENLKQFLVFLAVTFGVLSLTILAKLRVSRTAVALGLIVLLYTHVIMVYYGAAYNMRYYIPVLPLMALFIVGGFLSMRSAPVRNGLLGVFVTTNFLTIMVFNHQASNGVFMSYLERLPTNVERFFDNMRMSEHIAMASSVETINRAVPRNGKLYWISDYARDASYYIFQRNHLIREDVEVIYSPKLENLRPAEQHFVVFSYQAYPKPIDKLALEEAFIGARITNPGDHVYEVTLPKQSAVPQHHG